MTELHPAIPASMRREMNIENAADFGANPADDPWPYMMGYCDGSRKEAIRIADRCWADLVQSRAEARRLAARIAVLEGKLLERGIPVPA